MDVHTVATCVIAVGLVVTLACIVWLESKTRILARYLRRVRDTDEAARKGKPDEEA